MFDNEELIRTTSRGLPQTINLIACALFSFSSMWIVLLAFGIYVAFSTRGWHVLLKACIGLAGVGLSVLILMGNFRACECAGLDLSKATPEQVRRCAVGPESN